MTVTMNQMNHPILIHGEVTHLPVSQNIMREMAASIVVVEKNQPTLVEVHRDIQTMGEMVEMVVMKTHTVLTEVITRTDVLITITIEDTQYQQLCIHSTILLASWKWWNTTILIFMNDFSS